MRYRWPPAKLFPSTERRLGTRQECCHASCHATRAKLIIPGIVRVNCFVFFPRFPSSIRQEIPLLVYLYPLDCIDARIFKVSCFLGFIFIVLCSTFQNGLLILGFLTDTIWNGTLSLGLVSIVLPFTKLWRKIIDLPFCSVASPRPRNRFRVIFDLNLLCTERISKKSNVAKYAPNEELTTPALSDDTRLNLREKTRMLQKPKWRTYWAQVRLIVTIYGENVSPREADWSVVNSKVSHIKNSHRFIYSKHPHIRTNGLRTPGWNLSNKAPFL